MKKELFTFAFILLANTVQASEECEPHIGKIFWVVKGSEHLVDRFNGGPRTRFDLRSEVVSFKVNKCIELDRDMKIYQPTAQVELDNGTTSYVDAYHLSFRKPDLDKFSCNVPDKELYVFQYNPLELEQKCKDDKAALRSNRRDEFLEIFKANKIIVGRKAWVKSPIKLRDGSYLTAFTQIVFNGVDLKPDQPNPDLNSAKMRMLINGTEVETEYGLPTSLASQLTSENIAKKYDGKWGSKIIKAIKAQKIVLGMSREQTIMAWGKPQDIHETMGNWGKHEQWIYGDNQQYLYFENGKLTSYQD